MTPIVAVMIALIAAPAVQVTSPPSGTVVSEAIPAPRPAPSCWTMDVKHCCKAAAIPGPAQCNKDGVSWTCPPTIEIDPLIITYKLADTGYEGKQNNGTETCRYVKRNCGPSVLTCINDTEQEATCQIERGVGNLCESNTSE